MTNHGPERRFPLALKLPYTLFVAILVPIYWVQHGPANFLWFSDIALLGLLIALWRESSLLASMMAVGVLLPEIGWIIDFLAALALGEAPLGLAGYMLDPEMALYLRALSGFHLALPPLMLWMMYRLGYDERALKAQTLLAWITLLLSRLFSTPEQNINWVYGPGDLRQEWVPDPVYVGLLMVLLPLALYLPTHYLLRRWFRPRHPPVG